jgi:hypothetical protein
MTVEDGADLVVEVGAAFQWRLVLFESDVIKIIY